MVPRDRLEPTDSVVLQRMLPTILLTRIYTQQLPRVSHQFNFQNVDFSSFDRQEYTFYMRVNVMLIPGRFE